jgi:hypothetical protein
VYRKGVKKFKHKTVPAKWRSKHEQAVEARNKARKMAAHKEDYNPSNIRFSFGGLGD